MNKKILLLGKNGQVGWELQRSLSPLGELLALDSQMGDVTDFPLIASIFAEYQPDIVVNATAYTAVDKAEDEKEQARLVNELAVANLAYQCEQQNALLIHYSTDYVFAGTGQQAWKETDKPQPINYYGQTKCDGEIALEDSRVNFINFRTSWVYGTHGNNFVKTMLNLAKERAELSIINDQIGTPTSSALIADVTAHALHQYLHGNDGNDENDKNRLCGHYHLTANNTTSWYEYANFVFDTARELGMELAIKTIKPISTSQYPTLATRPLNSRLNTDKLQQTFQLKMPDWQQGVIHTLGEIIQG